jgi:predicted ATPase
MLTRLYATNYRCLVNFEFKPSAKQLIIGRNGAGKTTVFDVLALLRNVAALGLPLEVNLGGKTRTRWQDVPEQRFELDVSGSDSDYRYSLVVNAEAWPPGPSVKEERLLIDGEVLFEFKDGHISVFDRRQFQTLTVQLRSDGHRSGLAMAAEQVPDNPKLDWFTRWLGQLTEIQINPWAMSARSEFESREPAKDLGNFADWFRHLRLENGDAVSQALADVREAIPGFQSLDAKEAGLDVRVLQATIANQVGRKIELPFHDLSEGQRCLIALYVLLYCAVGQDRTLLLDEPDNFIALAEIQPWLMKLLDRVDETGGQVILVSHHPELLDQLANQGGVLLDRPGGGETRVRPFEPQEDCSLKASEIIARGWERA